MAWDFETEPEFQEKLDWVNTTGHRPSDDVWPTEWIPKKMDAARAKFAEYLEHEVGNL